MSISQRKYFIVFDRERSKKKDNWFNVNFFYLKSFKKKRKSFTYVNEPFFRGNVLFGPDMKNRIRPLQFNKFQKDGEISPIKPQLLKNFIFANENQFIAYSSQIKADELSPVWEMLNSFQYDKEKILELDFCSLCLDDRKFNLVNISQLISFKNRNICPDCALDIIIKKMNSSGLISNEHISPKLKNFFTHMVLKFKNIEKVLVAFNPEFNPAQNRELTVYDIEKSTPVSKKYLNFKIDDLKIESALNIILKKSNITTLLPVQAISIEQGLITERIDQLVMAPTSGGKTLVGELAGVSKLLEDKKSKMLYLVPIVALANIRTEEFKKKYKSLDLKVLKRVGESLLEKTVGSNLDDLKDANIIIATYEAIDFLLRSGNADSLGKIGTVIIDEIQMLIDPDRGFLLDGFIARLKSLYQESQFLYLSATIGAPEVLAQKLNAKLIRYMNRPVPIERHLILCQSENHRQKLISRLVRSAFYKKSAYGFKGQSIIFTNTRKKCEGLTTYLQSKGIEVRSYHSGLTSEERKIIESEFQSQKISGVVATAALAAGVDLPAQQVIFESLAMGIKWLSVSEFTQMLGRAGRLKKHDLGMTYLLVIPGKVYSPKMKITEENIAIMLLNGKIKDFELEPNEDKSLTELLAFISIYDQGINGENILQYYNKLINNEYELNAMIKRLNALKLIRIKENNQYRRTNLGQSIAKSFLTIERGLEIIKALKRKSKSIIDLVLNLKPLKNVYLSKSVVADLAKNIRMKYFSNNLFSASVLSLMSAESIKKKRGNYSRNFIDFVVKLTTEIFNCKCKDNPYCDCGRLNLERIILSLRIDNRYSVEETREFLKDEYKIIVFKGDIIDYLENLIYSFESIKNIAKGISNLDPDYKSEVSEIPTIINKIKNISK
jgi:helicase